MKRGSSIEPDADDSDDSAVSAVSAVSTVSTVSTRVLVGRNVGGRGTVGRGPGASGAPVDDEAIDTPVFSLPSDTSAAIPKSLSHARTSGAASGSEARSEASCFGCTRFACRRSATMRSRNSSLVHVSAPRRRTSLTIPRSLVTTVIRRGELDRRTSPMMRSSALLPGPAHENQTRSRRRGPL